MSRPTILTVDDDPQVSAAIARDLRDQYGRDYRIVRDLVGAEAPRGRSPELALRDQPVALIAVDQRMPRMTGIEMLARAQARSTPRVPSGCCSRRTPTPTSRSTPSTTSASTTTSSSRGTRPRSASTRFSTTCSTTGSSRTPTTPPRCGWSATGGPSAATRSRRSWPATTALPLVRRGARRGGRRLADLAGAGPDDLPLVLLPDGDPLRSPTNLEVADALGLSTHAEQPLYDVCIVGGGPAGLAAAVYAASEGLSTIVVERRGARRAGRPERRDRELPRLPARPERLRPDPARDGPGEALRRRDGARP